MAPKSYQEITKNSTEIPNHISQAMVAKELQENPKGFTNTCNENQEFILKIIVATTRNLTDATKRDLQPQVWFGQYASRYYKQKQDF